MLQLTNGISEFHLAQVYSDPYITGAISHDSRKAMPVIHPLATYLSAFIAARFVGAFLIIRYSCEEVEIHSLLHRDAIKQSRGLGGMAIEFAFSLDGVNRVTAYIIDGLHKAANFCRKLGFVDEGRRRDACMKNGIPTDVLILGMTRKDWMAA